MDRKVKAEMPEPMKTTSITTPIDTHRRTLTVAHLDHDPSNCRRDNLAALCAPCHPRYDAGHHAETRKARKAGR